MIPPLASGRRYPPITTMFALRLNFQRLVSAGVLAGLCSFSARAADPKPAVEQVLFKDGRVLVTQNGKSVAAGEPVQLPGAITVATNGTFTVGNSSVRRLREGQILGADGMLASPDGTLVPVFDHVAVRKGRAEVIRDGVGAPLTADLPLGDAGRITPDGLFIARDGRRTRLLDGQMRRLDGTVVAATDTATLIRGKVVLQKDGSRLEVAASQSITMSDGTKVHGSGLVIRRNGTQFQLKEGEVLKIQGASSR